MVSKRDQAVTDLLHYSVVLNVRGKKSTLFSVTFSIFFSPILIRTLHICSEHEVLKFPNEKKKKRSFFWTFALCFSLLFCLCQ